MLGNFLCILQFAIFQQSSFSKNSFSITIRVSNCFVPDQARHFVGSDLGPNYLQRSSAQIRQTTKVNKEGK